MEPSTLKALQESIEHWERLSTGTAKEDEGIGVTYCALCAKFYGGAYDYNSRCNGCPIMARTGCDFCGGTPYSAVSDYVFEVHDDIVENALDDPEFRRLAKLELDFLRSLLPTESTNERQRSDLPVSQPADPCSPPEA